MSSGRWQRLRGRGIGRVGQMGVGAKRGERGVGQVSSEQSQCLASGLARGDLLVDVGLAEFAHASRFG
jgi:hypothetical protein